MIFALHAIGVAIAHALPLIAGVALVTVALLTLPFLVSWFAQRATMVRANKHNIAVTFAEQMEDGRFNVVQGIFNQQEGTFAAVRRIIAERLADAVKRLHEPNPLTIWE